MIAAAQLEAVRRQQEDHREATNEHDHIGCR